MGPMLRTVGHGSLWADRSLPEGGIPGGAGEPGILVPRGLVDLW